MYQAPASTGRTRSSASTASTTQKPQLVMNQPDPDLDPIPQQNSKDDMTEEEGGVVDRPPSSSHEVFALSCH